MTHWIEPITLRGMHAQLEPLAASHAPALAAAAHDGELWRLWYTSAPHPDQIDDYVANALRMRDETGALPFAVRRLSDDRIVGCTRYFNVETRHRRLEIGHTWYSASAQRSALNTECKLLLLGHAFETLNTIAVELRTHFMNQASRRAIERLGAKLDGILRQHQIAPDGSLRDTCVYSIVAAEWPAVRSNLRWKLEQPRAGARS
ncbi:MAG: GNAT family N-acetyltransferase [Burkholderiales bacterium]|nr:GNAT family N-acetyltransferase [Burkholderiales bacterium]